MDKPVLSCARFIVTVPCLFCRIRRFFIDHLFVRKISAHRKSLPCRAVQLRAVRRYLLIGADLKKNIGHEREIQANLWQNQPCLLHVSYTVILWQVPWPEKKYPSLNCSPLNKMIPFSFSFLGLLITLLSGLVVMLCHGEVWGKGTKKIQV